MSEGKSAVGNARDDDFTIRLNCHGSRSVARVETWVIWHSKVYRDGAVPVETAVWGAIAVVTQNCKIARNAKNKVRVTSQQDFPVRLQGYPVSHGRKAAGSSAEEAKGAV